jgi:hypothetical protein
MIDQTGIDGNISSDPLFCDLAAGDLALYSHSPCLPANNDCGVLMGLHGQGCTLTAATDNALPSLFMLEQNHPNPFNPSTEISFVLPESAFVYLRVYDLNGRLVRSLTNGETYSASRHIITWKGFDDRGRYVASGVYFYSLEAGEYKDTRRMILLR